MPLQPSDILVADEQMYSLADIVGERRSMTDESSVHQTNRRVHHQQPVSSTEVRSEVRRAVTEVASIPGLIQQDADVALVALAELIRTEPVPDAVDHAEKPDVAHQSNEIQPAQVKESSSGTSTTPLLEQHQDGISQPVECWPADKQGLVESTDTQPSFPEDEHDGEQFVGWDLQSEQQLAAIRIPVTDAEATSHEKRQQVLAEGLMMHSGLPASWPELVSR